MEIKSKTTTEYEASYDRQGLDVGEKGVIDGIMRNLRNERRACIAVSIVILACIASVIVYTFVMIFVSTIRENGNEYASYALGSALASVLIITVMFCFKGFPDAIFGFVAAKKIKKCIRSSAKDPAFVRDHALAVRWMVLYAVFNQIALIFFIRSHIYVKRNSHILDKISVKLNNK
ncbi:MAG: hypothetical protein K6G89_02810 [Clostridia bacterium]|nr:hypothetical protein [Clostridia bacterium]